MMGMRAQQIHAHAARMIWRLRAAVVTKMVKVWLHPIQAGKAA